MAGNAALGAARRDKNDEFYTRYEDVAAEMEAYYEYDHDAFRDKTILCPCDDPEWSNFTRYFADNFERLGLRKLISTSYAAGAGNRIVSDGERTSPLYDPGKHPTHGKLFVMESDANGSGNATGIRFQGYLDGDGDFRSDEVKALRHEADLVITNPPFSLLLDFIIWAHDGGKKFIIIGNMNAITYKGVFPLIKRNEMWLGTTRPKEFVIPTDTPERGNVSKRDDGTLTAKFGNICWFTNVDHRKRHEPLALDTMEGNLKSEGLRRRLERSYGDATRYPRYDNYDAIEVPLVKCIPSDYDGIMGVPITFMERYDPMQFEIIGHEHDLDGNGGKRSLSQFMVNGHGVYKRVLIRAKRRYA